MVLVGGIRVRHEHDVERIRADVDVCVVAIGKEAVVDNARQGNRSMIADILTQSPALNYYSGATKLTLAQLPERMYALDVMLMPSPLLIGIAQLIRFGAAGWAGNGTDWIDMAHISADSLFVKCSAVSGLPPASFPRLCIASWATHR